MVRFGASLFVLALAFYSIQGLTYNSCGCRRDPGGSKCTGSARPGATRLRAHIKAKFGLTSTLKTNIYNCPNLGTWNAYYVHREGRAVDFIIGTGGVTATKAEQIFQYAKSIACKVGIQEVIYNARMWIAGSQQAIPSSFPAGQHKDHVHIGLNNCGSWKFA